MSRRPTVNDLKPSRFYSVISRTRILLSGDGIALSLEDLARKLTDGGMPVNWAMLRRWMWSLEEGGEPLTPPNFYLLDFGTRAKEEYAQNFAREMLAASNGAA